MAVLMLFGVLNVYPASAARSAAPSAAPVVYRLEVDTPADNNSLQNCMDNDLTNSSCSLRGAVEYANNSLSGPGTYQIYLQPNQTYTLVIGAIHTSGDIKIYGYSLQQAITGAVYDSPAAVIQGSESFPDSLFIVADGNLRLDTLSLTNGYAISGGAVYLDSISGSLTIANSALYDNHAEDGGAIFVQAGVLNVYNSTLTNNAAAVDGGAIYNRSGSVHLVYTTVADNQSISGAELYNESIPESFSLKNSLIDNAAFEEMTGAYVSEGNNVFALAPAAGGYTLSPGDDDLFGGDLDLQGFGSFGGPTYSYQIGANSPAIDNAECEYLPSLSEYSIEYDQRGVARGDRDINTEEWSACDSGAFEYPALAITGPGEMTVEEDTPTTVTLNLYNPTHASVNLEVVTPPNFGYIQYLDVVNYGHTPKVLMSYIPYADQNTDLNGGEDWVTIRASSSDGASSEYSTSILVLPTNDDPVAVDNGYYTYSSDPYTWVELSGQAGITEMTDGSNYDETQVGTIAMPFDFPFFNNTLSAGSSLYVYDDGVLSFNSYPTALVGMSSLPDDLSPHSTIVPLGGDHYVIGGATHIYWQHQNPGQPDERLVIEYENLDEYCRYCDTYLLNPYIGQLSTFEVLLYPDGRIQTHYKTVNGYVRTVGIENSDSSHGLSFPRYNVVDGTSVTYTPTPIYAALGQLYSGSSVLPLDYDADDPDGTALTYSAEKMSGPADLLVNPDGSYSFTPSSKGLVSFIYKLTDGDSSRTRVNQGQVVINVVDSTPQLTLNATLNGAPQASGGTMNEGQALQISANASGSDGALTYSVSGLPAGASFDPVTRVLNWTPGEAEIQGDANFTFTFTVTDPRGPFSDSQTFTLTVVETNTAPTLSAISNQTQAEGSVFTFTASAADSDIKAGGVSDTLIFSVVGAPSGASIDPSTGAFTWTPTEAQGPGVYTFNVMVSDGTTQTSTPVTLTVTEDNSAPALTLPSLPTDFNEGETLNFTATATDADLPSNTLTFSLVGAPSGASINANSGVFTWTPSETQGQGSYTFTVLVSDGTATDQQTVTIGVNEINQTPALTTTGPINVTEGAAGSYQFSATDADQDTSGSPVNTLTYTVTGLPAWMAFDSGTHTLSWNPGENDILGSTSLTLSATVQDDGGLFDTRNITVNVTEGNTAPVLSLPSLPTDLNEGDSLSFSASSTDADVPANTLSYAFKGAANGATLDPTSGAFTWTTTEAQGPGSFTFTIVVSDNGSPAKSAERSFTVQVHEVNQAPALTVASSTSDAEEHVEWAFAISFTDADEPSNPLTVHLSSGDPALQAAIDAGDVVYDSARKQIVWTPGESDGGQVYTLSITVNDGSLDSNTETVEITVAENDGTPILGTITAPASIPEEQAWSFTATAIDEDLDPNLVFSLNNAPAGASIHPTSGAFTWTPTEAQGPGSYTFDVIVTDSTNRSNSQTITVSVAEVNTAPALNAISGVNVKELATASFTASATDDDNPTNTLTYSLAGAPSGASINASSGAFTWTPTEAQGYPGASYTFDVVVTDNGSPALHDTHSVTITVEEVNTAPVFGALSNKTVNEGQTVTIALSATDSDLLAGGAPNTLTYGYTGSLPSGASFYAGTGIFSWVTSEASGPGSYPITFTVSDGVVTISKSVTITVKAVNDLALSVVDADDPVLAGATLTYTLTAENLDVDAASGVVMTAQLPQGVDFLAAESDAACSAQGQTLTCPVGSLSGSQSVSVVIAAAVHTNLPAGTRLAFSAEVSANETDANPGNNQATGETTVRITNAVYSNDFETSVGSEWSNNNRSTAPSGQRFLGEFNNQSITLFVHELPSHSQATVTFDLYVLRSWDGNQESMPESMAELMSMKGQPNGKLGPDLWEFVVDDETQLHTSFSNWNDAYSFPQSYPGPYPAGDYPARTGAVEKGTLGYTWEKFTGMDSVYHFTFHFLHTSADMTLTFRDLGLQGIQDEAWGLDNVNVMVDGGAKELPNQIFLPVTMR